MRTMILMPIIIMLIVAQPSVAQFIGPSFESDIIMVKAILDKPIQGMAVTLRGQILHKTTRDKYTFADKTGFIKVNIDSRAFPHNQPITPETLIEITGKVNTEGAPLPEIDVQRIVIVSPITKEPERKSGGFLPNEYVY